eukprot:TRINITY_DN2856_c0_g1_i2.p1 TRINITY_DN2856_c0_g1~~TRINITY_DN2856_c0_g1_i2.p1  ORF type:complete len:172 (+),score=45.76 TRINITY_DN2856_c0_g1_i2:90-605(+)
MGCSTIGGICGSKNDEGETKTIRRVKTMNYSSKPQQRSSRSLTKRIEKGKMECEKDAVTYERKELRVINECPDNNELCPESIRLNISLDKHKTKEMKVERPEEKSGAILGKEKDPKQLLLSLGYSIQPDDNEDHEHKTIVKQLVIPHNEENEKLLKQSTNEEEPTVARASS